MDVPDDSLFDGKEKGVKMTIWTTTMPCPIGELRLFASPKGIRSLLWPRNDIAQVGLSAEPIQDPQHELLKEAVKQVQEYFFENRKEFDLPLDPVGTEFQLLAWEALRAIPFGETRSYGEQAQSIGRPKAARAIGGANNKNPISLIVP
ncbi:MAG: methylated-DNA-[protein]-cysteine S-methyltransferase [Planctomycetota bacterium]